ncbi:hypothetical protein ABE068_22510 [Bacillus glycinifermentans]|uniref:Uncharacterized protein n=1 Tax=Bacillus glycinifermentans TaxID=1664069 RepID=A0ABU6H9D4_9BACI|nr:hypothetical protein [Bacillus glycinifermentans]MEC0487589.1 hypothetical protein [Bacillus glycinifermentans]
MDRNVKHDFASSPSFSILIPKRRPIAISQKVDSRLRFAGSPNGSAFPGS